MSYPDSNVESLAEFSRYVAAQKEIFKSRYAQLLAADLSSQQWEGCFQRNVLRVLAQTYDEALLKLQQLYFDASEYPIDRGLSGLSKQVFLVFDGFVDELLLAVVDKHRTSCALSNFPDEHKPDKVYVNQVRRDAAALWQNFALDVNAWLLTGEDMIHERVTV